MKSFKSFAEDKGFTGKEVDQIEKDYDHLTTVNQYISILKSNGFEGKVIGTGYYAKVWDNDKGKLVIKTSTDKNDGWLIPYIENFKNDTNPHILNVRSYRILSDGYIAIMERVTPGDVATDQQLKAITMLDPDPKAAGKVLHNICADFRAYGKPSAERKKGYEAFLKKNGSNSMSSCLQALFVDNKKGWNDVNLENIAFRKTTLVFMDPFG